MENKTSRKAFVFNLQWHQAIAECPATFRLEVLEAISHTPLGKKSRN